MVCSKHIRSIGTDCECLRGLRSYGVRLRSRSSTLWLNGPGETRTSSFKFCIAKQAFTYAILRLCTLHLRTAVHLCNHPEVPVPWRFGTNTYIVTPLLLMQTSFLYFKAVKLQLARTLHGCLGGFHVPMRYCYYHPSIFDLKCRRGQLQMQCDSWELTEQLLSLHKSVQPGWSWACFTQSWNKELNEMMLKVYSRQAAWKGLRLDYVLAPSWKGLGFIIYLMSTVFL